jgi:hypothetical protein
VADHEGAQDAQDGAYSGTNQALKAGFLQSHLEKDEEDA